MERWTKEQEQYLLDNYKTKMYCEISKEIGKTEGSIRAKCFDLGLVKNSGWSEEDLDYIKENYQRLSINEMAKVLNRTPNAVKLKAQRKRCKKYPYNCNYDYFKNIDTEEKAYWLGFIYADGYITINEKTNSGYVGIELQASDVNHLKKFNKSISGNYPITFDEKKCNLNDSGKIHKMCKIRLSSINMANDLIANGATRDKTYTMQLPNIPNELMCHFIRGYFDGDGCIYITKKNRIRCHFDSVSTIFLEQLRKFLYHIGINSYLYMSKNNNGKYKDLYRLEIAGVEYTQKFLQYIYNNSQIYLDRKYEKYYGSNAGLAIQK